MFFFSSLCSLHLRSPPRSSLPILRFFKFFSPLYVYLGVWRPTFPRFPTNPRSPTPIFDLASALLLFLPFPIFFEVTLTLIFWSHFCIRNMFPPRDMAFLFFSPPPRHLFSRFFTFFPCFSDFLYVSFLFALPRGFLFFHPR